MVALVPVPFSGRRVSLFLGLWVQEHRLEGNGKQAEVDTELGNQADIELRCQDTADKRLAGVGTLDVDLVVPLRRDTRKVADILDILLDKDQQVPLDSAERVVGDQPEGTLQLEEDTRLLVDGP